MFEKYIICLHKFLLCQSFDREETLIMSSEIISSKFLIEISLQEQTQQVQITLNLMDKSRDRFSRLKCSLQMLSSQIPLSHFSSIEDIQNFMNHEENYNWNDETKQLQLIWKVEGHEYSKIHLFCLKFQELNQSQQQWSLECQNKFLRKQAKFLQEKLVVKKQPVSSINEKKQINVLEEEENSNMSEQISDKKQQLQETENRKKMKTRNENMKQKNKHRFTIKNEQNKLPILMKDRKLTVVKNSEKNNVKNSVKKRNSHRGESPQKKKRITKKEKDQKKKKIIKFKTIHDYQNGNSNQQNSQSSKNRKNFNDKKQKSYYPFTREKKRISLGQNKYSIQYINGDTYVGQLRNNKYNGEGTYTGKSYILEGTWKNCETDGPGKFIFKNGGVESGTYKPKCKRFGLGEDKYQNGQSYVGQFINEKKNGKGRYNFANGDYYEGQWKDDKQHGLGVQYLKNGDKYVGVWHEDQKHGNFTFYSSEGKKQQVWQRGRLKNQIICLGSQEDE